MATRAMAIEDAKTGKLSRRCTNIRLSYASAIG